MSYILDALKKSERERKRGTVPDVLTVQEGLQPSAKKRSLWPVFVITALFLNAVLLLWWFAPWKADSQRTAAVKPPVHRQPQDSVKTEALPGSAKEELPRPTAQDAEIHAGSPKSRAVTGTEVTKLPKPSSGLVPDRQPDPGSREKDSGKAKKDERREESIPSEQPVAALPPAENRIYRLKELPDPLRKTLPDFSISAFLYSATPSSRMVRINGQMLHEGEELSPGLQLEEITPDGVIMSCRTYRFSIGVR